MDIDLGIDLREMLLDTVGETPRAPGRLDRLRIRSEIGGVQQPEGLLACVLLAHVTRVM
jgi:hypothetical protein